MKNNCDLQQQTTIIKDKYVLYYLVAFTIPLLIIILSLMGLNILPFGKHLLSITDGKYYINNLQFFSRLLKGQENWLYSFNNGIGGNNWSIIAWGAFSFGGLLSVFGTLETMPALLTCLCAD